MSIAVPIHGMKSLALVPVYIVSFFHPALLIHLVFILSFTFYFKSKVVVSILKVCKSTTTGKTIILGETTVRMMGDYFCPFQKIEKKIIKEILIFIEKDFIAKN